jgi:hypothetical protein
MRGLPDSAVVGTYKRLHRKPKHKAPIVSYDEQAEMICKLFSWVAVKAIEKTHKIIYK